MSERIDQAGLDTWLARVLIDEGVLDEAQVREALQAKRADAARETLARTLCANRVLDEETVDRLLLRTFGPGGSSAVRVPQRVGRYRLTRELGAGGMGVVYAAAHEATGAERAVKLMPRGDAVRAERFRREAEAMARVDHPNVVRVHDLGVDDRHLYLVMDLASGGSLEDRLHGGPLPFEEARSLARSLARGLAQVHAAGILHRDLKPGNVLFDEHGTPKLTDFGLARVAWEGSLTESGATMGTPSFIAPEQLQDSSRADVRADVYGLGAILYTALTGQPPFTGPNLMSVLSAVVRDRPVAPGLLRPGVPRVLEEACLRALEKDPADRPATAEAFEAALSQTPKGSRVSWLPAWLLLVTVGVTAALLYDAAPATPAPIAATPTPSPSTPPSQRAVPRGSQAWPRDDWNASGWFGPREQALLRLAKDSDRIRIPERSYPEFLFLARRGHPKGNRAVGIAFVTGVAPERNVGRGIQHLVRAVKGGDRAAAGYLGGLFLDRSLLSEREVDLGMLGGLGAAAELGHALDDHPLVAALSHLALKAKNEGFRRAARQVLSALARRGVAPAGRESRSWALVQRRFEPPEHAAADQAFWTTFERRVSAWFEREPALVEFQAGLDTLARGSALRQANVALAAGLRRRAVLAYRRAMEQGSDHAQAKLAELAWNGLLGFEPDPAVIVRWLIRLAERREYVAASVLFRSFLKPTPAQGVQADHPLAGAWLRLWTEYRGERAANPVGVSQRAGPSLVVPDTATAAWRVIRRRPVRYVGR